MGINEFGYSDTDEDKAATLDRALARKQADLLVEQLREEGRELAADIVSTLESTLGEAVRDLDEVRGELAELKAGTKSSRGKERASASGTLSGKGRAAGAARSFGSSKSLSPAAPSTHKHEYGPEGTCIKIWSGALCGEKRQRRAKGAAAADGSLPGQAKLPQVNGASGEATS